MYVEVTGVGFLNKGAELMMCAIASSLRQCAPGVQLVAGNSVGYGPCIGRYGLYHKLDACQWSRVGRIFDSLVTDTIRQRYGLVRDSEIVAVLDASGFAYGDQWRPEKTQRAAENCRRWKRQGKKVVLLPQAFGPFSRADIRQSFCRILDNTDLVFARDRLSYDYILASGGRTEHVEVAPDFTNLVDGLLPAHPPVSTDYACIVPNKKMIERSDVPQQRYLRLLAFCCRYFERAHLRPCVVLHDSGDEDVLRMLQAEYAGHLDVVREDDPRVLKGILGRSHVVVASRYHALVSALSQGVPSLATTWSHKYETLFEDYNCPALVVTSEDTTDDCEAKLDLLLEPTSRQQLISVIQQAAQSQKEATARLWDKVTRLVLA